jgi:CheY-like chemotaxis protein
MLSVTEWSLTRNPFSLDVLLVGDSDTDATLLRSLLREAQPSCELHIARGVAQARDFLCGTPEFSQVPVPHLIFLDWGETGEQVLAFLKADPHLRPIPVVIFGSEAVDEHVLRAYDLHASCWVVRGDGVDAQTRQLRMMIDFWARTAQLPRLGRSLQQGA